MNPGIAYAALAFFLWGLFPLYFRAIEEVAPIEILAHRMLWSLLFLSIVLTVRGQWKWLPEVRRQPRVIASFVASAVLLTLNWFVYIWAVNNGHVLDSSLGYFINPLVNVLLGVLLLKEKLRRLQWLAIALAGCGVGWLTWQGGQLPWIALILGASFGLYGLLRKTATLGAIEGLALETLLLAPLAIGGLLWLAWQGQGHFGQPPLSDSAWLLLAGPFTAVPPGGG